MPAWEGMPGVLMIRPGPTRAGRPAPAVLHQAAPRPRRISRRIRLPPRLGTGPTTPEPTEQDKPNTVVVYKQWASPAAMAAHHKTAHMDAFKKAAGPIVDWPPQAQLLTPCG